MTPEYFRLVQLYISQDTSVFWAFVVAACLVAGYALIIRAARKWQWLTWLYSVTVLFIFLAANLLIMGVSL
jgi:hypothetical protein